MPYDTVFEKRKGKLYEVFQREEVLFNKENGRLLRRLSTLTGRWRSSSALNCASQPSIEKGTTRYLPKYRPGLDTEFNVRFCLL